MHTRKQMAAIAGLLFSTAGFAKVDLDLESISGSYAECAAYYRVIEGALQASNEHTTAAKYGKLDEGASFYALLLANEGRDKGMAVKVTHGRIEMNRKAMEKEIGGRNENMAILINKYGDKCRDLLERPPEPVQRVMNRRIRELDVVGNAKD